MDAYIIVANNGMIFETKIGAKGINILVQVLYENDNWYMLYKNRLRKIKRV